MSVACVSNASSVGLTCILPKNINREYDKLRGCAISLGRILRDGSVLEIDCGQKGVMFGNYALTRHDERVTADMFKGGRLLDLISKEAERKVNVREETRLVKHRLFPRRHIFIILEPR